MKASIKEAALALLLVAACYILVALALDKIIMPRYVRHDHLVVVPDVVEMNLAQAESSLALHGFTIVVDAERYDAHYPAGVIMDQNPNAFAETKAGRRVYVTLSSGEQMCVMPNLIGKSERDAVFEAHSAGLTLADEDIGYEYSFYYPQGVIMAQSIPPGTKLKKDAPLHVTSSLGNLPTEFRIPKLVGMTLDRARKVILTSGLTLGETAFIYREDLLPNTVIKQVPEFNQPAEKEQKVDLVISSLDRKDLGKDKSY